LLLLLTQACALRRAPAELEIPEEAARHRAALATVIVSNATTSTLSIVFRAAPTLVQEVMIGTVSPGARVRLAPVPAGEPIVLVARKADGTELALEARSFPLDAEWVWEIAREATFKAPGAK
jgi:hypothetical protein